MINFLPNLEDGAQCLPSDVYKEICFETFSAEAHIDNIAKECVAMVLDEPVKSTAGIANYVGNFELGGPSNLKEQQNHFNLDEAFVGSTGTGVFLPRFTHPSVADATSAPRRKKRGGKKRKMANEMAEEKGGCSGEGRAV